MTIPSPAVAPAPTPTTTIPAEPDRADVVAAAVLAVDGVAALHGGMFGEVGTYLPGRRVAGVALSDAGAQVHVAVRYGSRVPAVADAVRAAVGPLVTGSVDVVIEDIVVEDLTLPDDPTSGTQPQGAQA